MISFDKDKIIYIATDFNMFFITASERMKYIRYDQEYDLTESFVDEIIRCIISKPNFEIIIDLNNVGYVPSRSLSRLSEYISRVIFYNVNKSMMISRIENELPELVRAKTDNSIYCIESRIDKALKLEKEIKDIRKNEIRRVIKSLISSKEEPNYLESSGLYSNFYVDVKQLFVNVQDFYYIVFCLAEQLYSKMNRVDAIVSSSKNGAIIACILAGLFDIKEVHIIGVGPKYAMKLGDSIDCIKEGKKYAFIYDFMCTGTELKIISALINSKKGVLEFAAGIAKYKEHTGKNILENVYALASTDELEIDYKIFGEFKREEIQ